MIPSINLKEKTNSYKELEYFTYPRKEMLKFIPSSCKTLLDIGCGAGLFGEQVKKNIDAEVWGIDPNQSVREIAVRNLDHFINDFFTDKINLPKKYFDVIVFNDSLEHFSDPFPPLEFCHSLLNKEGVIICSIPNIRYIENLKHLLIEMDWKYENSGIRDKTHLRFFTKKSIIRMFNDFNYKIISLDGINKRYWWWDCKRFMLIRFFIGKWILDMNYLQFVVVAKSEIYGE